jgi:pimeloyl-ACP methyl ester carboxylesterase
MPINQQRKRGLTPDSDAPRTMARPGGSIAFDVQGDGPLVVCLPGMGELRSSYRHTVPALTAAGYRVATMDLRGHGDSDATFATYDDVAAASDALALVGELGGEPAIIVGSSMSAGAAVWAAAEAPDLVAAVVLVGPFVRNAPMNPLLAWAFRVAMSWPWAPSVWRAYLPSLYPGQKPADFAEHRKRIRASMRRPGYAKAFSATTRTDHSPAEVRIGEVAAPALVVMGLADPDFNDPAAEAAWITERLGGEQLLVPDVGHYPHVQSPEVVNPVLVAFCDKVMRRA